VAIALDAGLLQAPIVRKIAGMIRAARAAQVAVLRRRDGARPGAALFDEWSSGVESQEVITFSKRTK